MKDVVTAREMVPFWLLSRHHFNTRLKIPKSIQNKRLGLKYRLGVRTNVHNVMRTGGSGLELDEDAYVIHSLFHSKSAEQRSLGPDWPRTIRCLSQAGLYVRRITVDRVEVIGAILATHHTVS